MPLLYSIITRHITHYLMKRDSSPNFALSLKSLTFLFLLSLFTTTVIINLLPTVLYKVFPASISLSLSSNFIPLNLYSSSLDFKTPRFFRRHDYELSDARKQQISLTNERTYTNDNLQSINISFGVRQEAETALNLALHLINSNKPEKARKIFEHALTLDPHNTDLLVEYGRFLEHYHKDLISAEHFYTRALAKQPTNSRALEQKRRTSPLVQEIDQNYFTYIDNILKEFYRISDTNPYLRRAKRDAYYLHIYHSNGIEGNTLTLRETQYIVETHLAVGGKSLIEQQEVLGLDLAWQYVNSTLANRMGSIKYEDIMEIHRRVLGFVNPVNAGQLRQHQVYVGSFTPPPPAEVRAYLDDFLKWLNSSEDTRDVHAIELAAKAHYKFVYIHPFIDGNGRTGRLLMNLILMRFGFPPVIIKKAERSIYYSYLQQANDGDMRPLIRFIAKCTERDLKNFIYQSQSARGKLQILDDVDLAKNFIEERVIIIE